MKFLEVGCELWLLRNLLLLEVKVDWATKTLQSYAVSSIKQSYRARQEIGDLARGGQNPVSAPCAATDFWLRARDLKILDLWRPHASPSSPVFIACACLRVSRADTTDPAGEPCQARAHLAICRS